jgi:hypothetical protein
MAPVDDLGFVDQVSVVISGLKARTLPGCAVHVGDGATVAAHQVMMIVVGPGFE